MTRKETRKDLRSNQLKETKQTYLFPLVFSDCFLIAQGWNHPPRAGPSPIDH